MEEPVPLLKHRGNEETCWLLLLQLKTKLGFLFATGELQPVHTRSVSCISWPWHSSRLQKQIPLAPNAASIRQLQWFCSVCSQTSFDYDGAIYKVILCWHDFLPLYQAISLSSKAVGLSFCILEALILSHLLSEQQLLISHLKSLISNLFLLLVPVTLLPVWTPESCRVQDL